MKSQHQMIRQFIDHGWMPADIYQAVERANVDSVADCADHCQAEPDGSCEHGFPSVLVALGLI